MKRFYALVQRENEALIAEYLKRQNNHQSLVSNLKELNAKIKQASAMRLGAAAKKVVDESRDCVRTQKFDKMPKVSS